MAGRGGEDCGSGAAGPSQASEAAEAPDDFVCPITAEIMTDPVSTSDGFTYERAAITEWLRTKDTSPKTGAKLESTTLYPNHSLRSVIRAFTEAGSAPSTAHRSPRCRLPAGVRLTRESSRLNMLRHAQKRRERCALECPSQDSSQGPRAEIDRSASRETL